MDITKMTAAQRAELKAQLEAEERAEKQKREESIAAYKSSVDEFCRNKFSRLQALSEEMRRLKEEVFGDAETLIALKDELFRTKSDRHSNQFTTSDGKITVALGYRTNDGWDDTVNVGVDKVKTFIKSLMPTAAPPPSRTAWIMGSMRTMPSVIEYSEWKRR